MSRLHFCWFWLALMGHCWVQAQVPEYPYPVPSGEEPAPWMRLLYQDSINPATVLAAKRTYDQTHPVVKNQHQQYFKRWERQLARAPYWSGMTPQEQRHYQAQDARYLAVYRQLQQGRSNLPAWRPLGPFTFDKEAASSSYACGAAHVYTVEQAPSNAQVLYAGTATAGVWRSQNGGQSWELTTAAYPITTVRALAIDPFNPNTAYCASDRDGHLYKTTDGGNTWSIIGDPAFRQLRHQVGDIVIHPQFSNILWLASDQGLYRSTSSGNAWTQVLAHSTQEIEYRPGQPNTVYAVAKVGRGTQFFKSTDAGATFVQKPIGWPVPATALDEQLRTEIAVSAADPNRVYALCAGAVGFGSGLYGIYVSTDAGETWSARCCGAHLPNYLTPTNPNLLHWFTTGTGNGGQYYYDLALAVSPTHADSVWLAGINLWVSGDGAQSFACPAPWNASTQPNYVHADIHDIRHYGSKLWVACDGGIFYSDDYGQTFQPRQTGIQGTDFWGFGAGFRDGDVLLGGTFHNGTLLKDGQVYQGGWLSTDGGDNYRGEVHPVYDRLVYSDYGQTYLSGDRMVPNTLLPFGKLPHASRTVGLSGNLATHPQRYHTLYSTFYDQLWRSDDLGATWILLHDFGSGLLSSLHIAWRNPDILYLNHYPQPLQSESYLYRSADGGLTWTDITPDSNMVPQDRWVGYDLALDAKNPQRLWAARVSPYEGRPILDGYQVFESNDGGQTWVNRTTPTLNGVYGTNLVHQRGSTGGLYLGTRRGVYYTDDSLNNWVPYHLDLPAYAQSVKLVPDYRGAQLRNGTPRSVYEAYFHTPSVPVAQISVQTTQAQCPRDTFYFAHRCAADSSAQYTWQFEQGIPAQSNQPYPAVVFPQAGDFSVTLTVSTVHGRDTQVLSQFVQVDDHCQPDTIPATALHLTDRLGTAETPPLRQRFSHLTLSAWVYPDSIPAPRTGLLTHLNDTVPAGLLLNDHGELTFCWGACPWSWRSGLWLPPNAWSHVALVVTPDSLQVVLNGVAVTYRAQLGALEWASPLVIGRFANVQGRTFQGAIEEVSVWDTALTLPQLQQKRHLTRYTGQEPHLLHYYQFNNTGTMEQDRQGSAHLTLKGSARRRRSTAPVGGGRAVYRASVGLGQQALDSASWRVTFGQAAPLGALVATRLHVAPDTAPAPHLGSYWIANAYGGVDSVAIDSLWLGLPFRQPFPSGWHRLYARSANAEGATWGAPLDSVWLAQPSPWLGFGRINGRLPLGQWFVGSDSARLVPVSATPLWSESVQLYPNPLPLGQALHVELPPTPTIYTLCLYTSDGKICAKQTLAAGAQTVSFSSLASGWYVVVLQTEGWQQARWLRVVP